MSLNSICNITLNARAIARVAMVKSTGAGHKDCPPPLPRTRSTPPVQQQQLILAPQATLRLTGGVPGKVGLHQTTYVCFVYSYIFSHSVFLTQRRNVEVDVDNNQKSCNFFHLQMQKKLLLFNCNHTWKKLV